jgi:hypothetical protein
MKTVPFQLAMQFGCQIFIVFLLSEMLIYTCNFKNLGKVPFLFAFVRWNLQPPKLCKYTWLSDGVLLLFQIQWLYFGLFVGLATCFSEF